MMPRKPASFPEATPKPDSPQASRGERRKKQTRERLLQAAFRLFAERGVETVTINEITEAADVGFGTFYNHFASKEQIHHALLAQVFEEFGDALDALATQLDDPAEVVAASVRHTVRRAEREPLWAKLLIREGPQDQNIGRGLGPRLFRDIRHGLDSGRFSTPDPWLSFIVAGAGVLGAITAQTLPDPTGTWEAHVTPDPAINAMAERTAAAVLHVLGLSHAEAEEVVRRPLPQVSVEE